MHTTKYLILTNVNFNSDNINPDNTEFQLINKNMKQVNYKESQLLNNNSCACTVC